MLIYSTKSTFLPQPYLRQNELAVISLHKYSEESDELLFSNLTGQKSEEEVTLNSQNNKSTQSINMLFSEQVAI